MKGEEVLFSSRNENWSTPQGLFDNLNSKYKFTIDVCADTSNKKVKKYFDKKANGLEQPWVGEVCWCNPPYGKEIKNWAKKASEEAESGTKIVMLVPSRTDTIWFHKYIYGNPRCSIVFVKGRLKFSNCNCAAPFPNMLILFNIDEPEAMRYGSKECKLTIDFEEHKKLAA